MTERRHHRQRAGAIIVLTAVMLVVLLGMIAMAVDIGYILVVRTELQTSADAAALAATWDLMNSQSLTQVANDTGTLTTARGTAESFAAQNLVARTAPELSLEDVVFGRLEYPFSPGAALTFADPSTFNATHVHVRRASAQNGQVPLFFANVFGITSFASEAQATAAFVDNFSGFTLPENSTETLPILPFALDVATWTSLLNGSGDDRWGWDPDSGALVSGSDGVPEANLFPQGTNSPGNRGTVDIGSSNNSTKDLSRQIREGVSAADLAQIGGSLELGADGTLQLNGDTGISAGTKDDLATIVGKTRIIPLFNHVVNPGNNAQYTIVGFAGVRILTVKLTGKLTDKHLIIQPARVSAHGGIPATDGVVHSYYIYSPVQLVQ